MKLSENLYFYEGDYVDKSRKGYFGHYKGMASSNFLVITGDQQVLIDSGMDEGPHRGRIDRELKKDSIDLNKTKQVLFSHSHPDHTLKAKKMSFKKPLTFYLHEDNEEMVRNDRYFFESFFNYPDYVQKEIFILPAWMIKIYVTLMGMNFGYLKIDRFFRDYETLHFTMDLQIIPLFSHCPGHVGFYFPKEKIFFSGDLYDPRCAEGAGILVSNSSIEMAFEDINRALNLDIETLLPGHGRPVFGKEKVRRELEAVKRGTENYLEKIRTCMRSQPSEEWTITALKGQIFTNSIAYNAFSRKIITYNCLRFLHKLGEVKFTVRKNHSYWRA
jgi:glyoxylase-like metal-dependent hydrolase (beta-lactamase superfamily II)